ncbi:DUF1211 domain-containing protein [Methanobrevibacter sp. OttesenSCG-928-K11]|nr:DUF1211 domain-containing protein [Methanobrevibacter sp. OttesenSCG-928-K11]MDL2270954.1 DUF1211 domain-containing protein [Methanobrevibacter sp. OttesenSCG-928-I08]
MENLVSKIPTSRLEAITDGIFAVAMTILVLSIEAPSPAELGSGGVYGYLISLIPKLTIFVISFILLGTFWMNHHAFFLINKVNQLSLWINLFWLMGICLIPFSVSLVAGFEYSIFAEIFFGLNMLYIGVLYCFNIYYAHKKGFFNKEIEYNINRIMWSPIFLILISFIDIGFSIIYPSFNKLFYLLIPLLILIPSRFFVKLKFLK